MLHALSLLPHLLVARNAWVYAGSVQALGSGFVVVYRSVWLRETSPKLAEVHEFIGRHEGELLCAPVEVEDERIVHRKAILSIYRVQGTSPAPGLDDHPSVESAVQSFLKGIA